MYANIAAVTNPCDNAYPINRRSFNSFPYVAKVPDKPPVSLSSGGNVSRNTKVAEININTLIAPRTMKTPRHVVNCNNCPPIIGAKIGAAPFTNISSEKNFVISEPEYISRTMARDITIPADPEAPCRKRNNTNVQIDGATAQSKEEAT